MGIPNRFGNSPSEQNDRNDNGAMSGIVGYIQPKLIKARDHRDGDGRKERWEEYTRLWRGMWGAEDKNRSSERSKLIAPALQQSVEMTVAEMTEATFGRSAWIDIDDDIQDEEKEDATLLRDQLLEDFELNKVPDAIRSTYLLGALYGTGISKIDVREKITSVPERMPDGSLKSTETTEVVVELVAIRPDQALIDESATNINDAQFFAHEMLVPLHSVQDKQGRGIYRKGHVPRYNGGGTFTEMPKLDGVHYRRSDIDDAVLITEVFARVPAHYIPGAKAEHDGRVEAIIVLANESFLLKAVVSPYTMKDRPIIAYQHEKVPGEFWGRGVSEKGYNPQKALDAELRARIDALALTTSPMMGADVTRMPRNPDLRVRPGKVWMTRGRPSEILEPVQFPPINPATFQQSGDLERMVQMATGAMDSATPIGNNRRNETASGMSQLNAGFIKRAKLTMHNIEQNYLDELVKKSLWRYMQFSPTKYPADYKLVVNSTMGIMARELEQQQLTQMLGFVPPDSPAHKVIVGAILRSTTSSAETDVRNAIKELSKPPSEEEMQMQQKMQQMAMAKEQAEIAKLTAEAEKLKAEVAFTQAKQYREMILAELEDDKVEIMAANAVTGAEKTKATKSQTRATLAGKMIDAGSKRDAAKSKATTNGGG
jgi:hypothetical protein